MTTVWQFKELASCVLRLHGKSFGDVLVYDDHEVRLFLKIYREGGTKLDVVSKYRKDHHGCLVPFYIETSGDVNVFDEDLRAINHMKRLVILDLLAAEG
jgi:hypothetical protein